MPPLGGDDFFCPDTFRRALDNIRADLGGADEDDLEDVGSSEVTPEQAQRAYQRLELKVQQRMRELRASAAASAVTPRKDRRQAPAQRSNSRPSRRGFDSRR
eukprot:TRINITY_DN38371_c0_g1_i1.p2 TRINITY_DN38371_c0_g1~~TRINITY_DN38371_c0_g1_i1.p2  ORF type:complete len:102 (+),score=28.43 TRINITY_DN38371_c0_g1_i1:56-361(+)